MAGVLARRIIAVSADKAFAKQLAVALKAGDGTIAPTTRERFDAWRAKLPQPLDRAGAWERKGKMVRFGIPLPEGAAIDAPHLFLETQNVVDYPAPQEFSRNGNWIVVEAAVDAMMVATAMAAIRRSEKASALEKIPREMVR